MVTLLSGKRVVLGSEVEREAPLHDGPPVKGKVIEDLGDEVAVGWADGSASVVGKSVIKKRVEERGRGDW